jgi:hypothetical protein
LFFQPVRKVVHRSNVKHVGFFPSDKVGRNIAYESLLELKYIHFFEYDKSIISYCEQPLDIIYIANGKKAHYFPDFALQTNTNIIIIEIKPSKKINDPRLQLKFAAGKS